MEYRIEAPESVRFIIKRLKDNNYDAYAVGGCVRDSILGRVPKDWDITTDATPMQVKAIFRKTIDTGIQHGTVTVMIDHTGYEVTTYRIDGEYEDSRHPKEVIFTQNLRKDLERRDFTINAMAYNDYSGVVDEFDGIGDIKRHVIRCVGDPMERFSEDALRIMRAVRFSAQLSFDIEDETRKAIVTLAGTLKNISRERIHTELLKTLMSDNPWRVKDMFDLGIMPVIIPETCKCDANYVKTLLHEDILDDSYLRMAALFSGLDYKTVYSVIKGLKLDNNTLNYVSAIIKYENYEVADSERAIRHFASECGVIYASHILRFKIAKENIEDANNNTKGYYRHIYEVYQNIVKRGDALTLKELNITGDDLKSLGIAPGKEMGNTLKRLFNAVLDEPELNDYDKLKEML
ncbi:CCA tRNA nucleotidyltransferase [Falcatimonas sp. MSJ-15]|nr:CCA tRNA nucleotidyltransferase [Falcatimonas sp. MSJ-15]